jgi:hypothetical protein
MVNLLKNDIGVHRFRYQAIKPTFDPLFLV